MPPPAPTLSSCPETRTALFQDCLGRITLARQGKLCQIVMLVPHQEFFRNNRCEYSHPVLVPLQDCLDLRMWVKNFPIASFFAFSQCMSTLQLVFLSASTAKIIQQVKLPLNMALGFFISRKRYTGRQITAVAMLACSIVLFQMIKLAADDEAGESNDPLVGSLISLMSCFGSVLGCLLSEVIMKKTKETPFYVQKFHQEIGGIVVGCVLLLALPYLGRTLDALESSRGRDTNHEGKQSLWAWKAVLVIESDVGVTVEQLFQFQRGAEQGAAAAASGPQGSVQASKNNKQNKILGRSAWQTGAVSWSTAGSSAEAGTGVATQAEEEVLLPPSVAQTAAALVPEATKRFLEQDRAALVVAGPPQPGVIEITDYPSANEPTPPPAAMSSAAITRISDPPTLDRFSSLAEFATLQQIVLDRLRHSRREQHYQSFRDRRRDEELYKTFDDLSTKSKNVSRAALRAPFRKELHILKDPAVLDDFVAFAWPAAPSQADFAGVYERVSAEKFCKNGEEGLCFERGQGGKWGLWSVVQPPSSVPTTSAETVNSGSTQAGAEPVNEGVAKEILVLEQADDPGVSGLGTLAMADESDRRRWRMVSPENSSTGAATGEEENVFFIEGKDLHIMRGKLAPGRRSQGETSGCPSSSCVSLQEFFSFCYEQRSRPRSPTLNWWRSKKIKKNCNFIWGRPPRPTCQSIPLLNIISPGLPFTRTSFVCDPTRCPPDDFAGYAYLSQMGADPAAWSKGVLRGYERGFFAGWDLQLLSSILWMSVNFWCAGIVVKYLSSLWKNIGQCLTTLALCLLELYVYGPPETIYSSENVVMLLTAALLTMGCVLSYAMAPQHTAKTVWEEQHEESGAADDGADADNDADNKDADDEDDGWDRVSDDEEELKDGDLRVVMSVIKEESGETKDAPLLRVRASQVELTRASSQPHR